MNNKLKVNDHHLDKTKLLALIYSNKKIQAIKYIKDMTNIGLKDAKEIADNLENDINYYTDDAVVIVTKPKFRQEPRSKKGSHFIKNNHSRNKNAIITILIAIIILLIMYILA